MYISSPDFTVKKNVLLTASSLFDVGSIPILLRGLNSSSSVTSDTARDLLIAFKNKENELDFSSNELGQLEESYISSPDSTVQNNILLTASSLFDVKSIPILLRGLNSSSSVTSNLAKDLLIALNYEYELDLSSNELKQLEKMYISSPDSTVQRNVLLTASSLFDVKSIPILLRGLNSSSSVTSEPTRDLLIAFKNKENDEYAEQTVDASKIENETKNSEPDHSNESFETSEMVTISEDEDTESTVDASKIENETKNSEPDHSNESFETSEMVTISEDEDTESTVDASKIENETKNSEPDHSNESFETSKMVTISEDNDTESTIIHHEFTDQTCYCKSFPKTIDCDAQALLLLAKDIDIMLLTATDIGKRKIMIY